MKQQHYQRPPRAPLWKWIVIILLVIGMPMFFYFYRIVQLQRALQQTTPVSTQPAPATSP